MALHQQLGNREGRAYTYDSLACVHQHLGDRLGEAGSLTRLGDTHHAGGDPTAAGTAWRQALEILEALDHPDADQVRAKL